MGNTNASKTEGYIQNFYITITAFKIEDYLKIEKDQDKITSIESNLEKLFDDVQRSNAGVPSATPKAVIWRTKLKLSAKKFDSDSEQYLEKINDKKTKSTDTNALKQELNKDFEEIIKKLEWTPKNDYMVRSESYNSRKRDIDDFTQKKNNAKKHLNQIKDILS